MIHGPDLPTLRALFGLTPPPFAVVPAWALPPPYRALLDHAQHMTVTVEKHFDSLVDVRVLDRVRDGDSYARQILLALQSDGRVVQYGIVRIHLHFCSDAVAARILEEKTPLGRILIEGDVLRRIEPTSFVRVAADDIMAQHFGVAAGADCFGRLGIIHCDGQPAIELLEVLAPGA